MREGSFMTANVLSLMFHRVNDSSSQCDPSRFSAFLNYLVNTFPIVRLGDPLPSKGTAVMLTFDDAYYDFYHHVFPLLKSHQVPALLAVPVKYIVDSTNLSSSRRLSVPYPQGMENDDYQTKAPFCTWPELQEMASSSYVTIASHSHSHVNMTSPNVDFNQEIVLSKQILESKLQTKITSFVYPFGKMNKKAHDAVLNHYQYGVRIGSALNRGWDQKQGHLYRVDADHLWKHHRLIDPRLIRKLTLKYWLNRIRGK